MKKIALLLLLLPLMAFAPAQTKTHPAKKDTVRAINRKNKPVVVEGRKARMRLQLQQIRQHKKPLKEVDSVHSELDKELHKPDQQNL